MERNQKRANLASAAAAAALAAVVSLALAVPAVPASAYADDVKAAPVTSLVVERVSAQAALSTNAAAKKVKKIKKQAFTASTKKINKKATKVKKGTTKLKLKRNEGYIKFTAKKTKKYSFKFSNLRIPNPPGAYIVAGRDAFFEPQIKSNVDPKRSLNAEVATKGGKSIALWLGEKGFMSKRSNNVVDWSLPTRTGKIKLKKGQDIYFYCRSSEHASFTLKIS